jgi:hypothetical protein
MVIHIVSFVLFLFLGILWSKENVINFMFRMVIISLAIWHLFEAGLAGGYIVRF